MVEVNGGMVGPLGGAQDPSSSHRWPLNFRTDAATGGMSATSTGASSWKWGWPFSPKAPDFGQPSKHNKAVTVKKTGKCSAVAYVHIWVHPIYASVRGCDARDVQSVVDAVDKGVNRHFQNRHCPCPPEYDGGEGLTISVQVVWHTTPDLKKIGPDDVTPLRLDVRCEKWEKGPIAYSQTGDWIWTMSPTYNQNVNAWDTILAHEIGHQLITSNDAGFDHQGHNTKDPDNTDDPKPGKKSGPLQSGKPLTEDHSLSEHEACTIARKIGELSFEDCCKKRKKKAVAVADDDDAVPLPPWRGSAPPRERPGVLQVTPLPWLE